jgi:hypothetical protein
MCLMMFFVSAPAGADGRSSSASGRERGDAEGPNAVKHERRGPVVPVCVTLMIGENSSGRSRNGTSFEPFCRRRPGCA